MILNRDDLHAGSRHGGFQLLSAPIGEPSADSHVVVVADAIDTGVAMHPQLHETASSKHSPHLAQRVEELRPGKVLEGEASEGPICAAVSERKGLDVAGDQSRGDMRSVNESKHRDGGVDANGRMAQRRKDGSWTAPEVQDQTATDRIPEGSGCRGRHGGVGLGASRGAPPVSSRVVGVDGLAVHPADRTQVLRRAARSRLLERADRDQTAGVLTSPPDDRVVAMWRDLASAPTAFAEPGVSVVCTDAARLTRPGWCGVVVLGGAAVVVTPLERPAQLDRLLASASTPLAFADPGYVEEVLGPLEETLGPADLQYGAVRGAAGASVQGPLAFWQPLVQRVRADAPAADCAEAGFEDEAMTGIFVAVARNRPVAMSGHRPWPGDIAHMGALAVPAVRGQGLGKESARAAAAFASDQGLLVQWRSLWSNDASRRLGAALGLQRCGRQLSFRLPSAGT